MSAPLLTHRGACHCGAVRFEVDAPAEVEVLACNCSMCERTGFLHLIVPERQFRLLAGADDLTEYRFNTGVARHLFCRTCGVKGFYRPRSNPDGWSVNLRCLERGAFTRIIERAFDGQHWEAAEDLAHLSR